MSLSVDELKDLNRDYEIDAIGEVCPHTLDLALKGIKKAKSGETIVEVTDHTMATKTIPAAVKMNKLAKFLGIVEENGNYHIYLRKA